MRLRRGLVLGLVAGTIAVTGGIAAHELAMARQRPIVVMRFLAGYYDRKERFVATAGRRASNIDRDAVLMFVMSGAVDTGPKIRATLPLTLAEQAQLEFLSQRIAEGNATPEEQRQFRELGGEPGSFFEPGVLARKDSPERASQFVATGSVSQDSCRIVSTTGGGETQATGVFFKVMKGNGRRARVRKFVFDPRYRSATFNAPGEIDYNPEGFESVTTYQITMDGGPDASNPLTTVQNRDGLPMAEPFTMTFTTSDSYAQDFSRPEVRGSLPGDGTPNVPSDADVDISFSEPMDISTFNPPRFPDDEAATVMIRYTSSALNGGLAGRDILVDVRVKPQTAGNVVQLRPLQGFGQGPFEVAVTITNGVTDLSGNNIIRQLDFLFTTEEDPTADSFAQINETYDTNTFEDTNFTSNPGNLSGDNTFATWNSKAQPGALVTTVSDQLFVAQGPSPNGFVNVWFPRALRWQMLFPSNDMGGRARTLTGFSWVQTNAQANLTYPNTQVRVGHATDSVSGGGFPGGATPEGPVLSNYRATPVVVTPSINYTIPAGQSLAQPPPNPPVGAPFLVAGPTWAKNFEFDGKNSVILEIEHFGNGTGNNPGVTENWENDPAYSINAMTFSLFQDTPPVIQSNPWYFTVLWSFLSPGAEAQSIFYNVLQPAVRWVPQQLVPFSQPQGTSLSFRWQGAKADLNDPLLIDPSTLTPWTSDIRTLAGNPFVRWHVEMTNNLSSESSPTIDTLVIPFTFR
jgi:hypothetical protein